MGELLAAPLPLFVYGSLRPGQRYHHLVGHRIAAVRGAGLPGARLYDAGPYPYVLPGPGTVRGELLQVLPGLHSTVLAELDRLEGYLGPGHPANDYERLCRTVVTDTGEPLPALVYLAAAARVDAVRAMPAVPGGDWVAHLAART